MWRSQSYKGFRYFCIYIYYPNSVMPWQKQKDELDLIAATYNWPHQLRSNVKHYRYRLICYLSCRLRSAFPFTNTWQQPSFVIDTANIHLVCIFLVPPPTYINGWSEKYSLYIITLEKKQSQHIALILRPIIKARTHKYLF